MRDLDASLKLTIYEMRSSEHEVKARRKAFKFIRSTEDGDERDQEGSHGLKSSETQARS